MLDDLVATESELEKTMQAIKVLEVSNKDLERKANDMTCKLEH
jgi:hypothetical protein